MQYRQGDVLLVAITPDERTIGAALATQGKPAAHVTLAYGEATGHRHALVAERPALLAATVGGRMLIHVLETARLAHEDHGAPRDAGGAEVPVLPGWYEVHTKREYADPVRGVARTR